MSKPKPTLASLRGIAPDITDGKDAVTYLHDLRGGQPLVDAQQRIAELEAELADVKCRLAVFENDPDRCSICGGYDPDGTHLCDLYPACAETPSDSEVE